MYTDDSGKVSRVYLTDPFGRTILSDVRNDSYLSSKSYATYSTLPGSGLLYARARMYDPVTSLFLSEDPLAPSTPSSYINDPEQLNTYSYARNNPIVFNDPTGEWAELPKTTAFFYGMTQDSYDVGSGALYLLNEAQSSLFGESNYTRYQRNQLVNTPEFITDDVNVQDKYAGIALMGAAVSPGPGGKANAEGKAFGKFGEVALSVSENLKTGVSSEKLIKAIDWMYKKSDNLPHGTIGAYVKENVVPGLKVGGRQHSQKIIDLTNQINKVINNQNSTERDKEVSKFLLDKISVANKFISSRTSK